MQPQTVTIKAGEKVRFPVDARHPLAKYQQFKKPSQMPDVHNLAIVARLRQQNPRISEVELNHTLAGILDQSLAGQIIQLQFPDIFVEKGGELVCGGPVTTLQANKVTVKGKMTILGSMNLTCSELGG